MAIFPREVGPSSPEIRRGDFDKRQPGDWPFNILPYLEQSTLHQLGANDGNPTYLDAAAFIERTETPVPVFYCPSRRPAKPVPIPDSGWQEETPTNVSPTALRNEPPLARVCFIDYAANTGSFNSSLGVIGEVTAPSYSQGDRPGHNWLTHYFYLNGGICFMRSEIRLTEIEDGLSSTYLVGEKRVDSRLYQGPNPEIAPKLSVIGDFGDPYRSGMPWTSEKARRRVCIQQFGLVVPLEPRPDSYEDEKSDIFGRFGSAHNLTFHMALCDGSVRGISYEIEPHLHVRLGLRDDGLPADPDMPGPIPRVSRE